jgi:RHS repeat-associated protein
LGTRWTLRFDELGLLKAASDALGQTKTYIYNQTHQIVQVIQPDGAATLMTYDATASLLSETDEEGRITSYERDLAGNITRLTDPSGGILAFQYNSEGELIGVTNERGEQHELFRDRLGRCVAQKYFDGVREDYDYDPCGRMIRFSASDGNSLAISRQGNRISRIESTDGLTDQFEFDAAGSLSSFSRNELRVKIKSDICGRNSEVEQGDWKVSYSYDAVGRRVGILESGGAAWSFKRDVRGRVIQLQNPGGTVHSFEFDQADRLVIHNMPNGLRQHLRYTERNQISQETVLTPAGSSRLERSYEYDRSGLRTAMRDRSAGHFTYRYTAAGLLSHVYRDGRLLHEYAYDATRNLAGSVRVDAGDRVIQAGDERFSYDPRGRVATWNTSRRTLRFSYLFDGTVARVIDDSGWEVSYEYDPFGRRMRKRLPQETQTLLWDDSTPLVQEIQRASGVERTLYTWLPDNPLTPLSIQGPSGLLVLHVDPVGTVDLAWNERGEEVWRWDREGWATNPEAEATASALGIPFRHPGQFFDQETGLYYNRWRYYVPSSARYLTPDPIRLSGGTNLYGYAPDPYNWADPWGMQLTVFGTTIQPIASLVNSQASVYRVDCSNYTAGPANVCTSPRGVPAARPAVQSRAGGGPPHNQCVMDLAQGPMNNEPNFSLARINQAQISLVAGVLEKVGTCRPDAWGLSNGRSVHGECDNQQANATNHAQTLCSNDPQAIVYLAVIP